MDPTELNVEAQHDALQAWRKAFKCAKSSLRETEEEDSTSPTSKTDKDAIRLAVEQAEACVRKLYEKEIQQLKNELNKSPLPTKHARKEERC